VKLWRLLDERPRKSAKKRRCAYRTAEGAFAIEAARRGGYRINVREAGRPGKRRFVNHNRGGGEGIYGPGRNREPNRKLHIGQKSKPFASDLAEIYPGLYEAQGQAERNITRLSQFPGAAFHREPLRQR